MRCKGNGQDKKFDYRDLVLLGSSATVRPYEGLLSREKVDLQRGFLLLCEHAPGLFHSRHAPRPDHGEKWGLLPQRCANRTILDIPR